MGQWPRAIRILCLSVDAKPGYSFSLYEQTLKRSFCGTILQPKENNMLSRGLRESADLWNHLQEREKCFRKYLFGILKKETRRLEDYGMRAESHKENIWVMGRVEPNFRGPKWDASEFCPPTCICLGGERSPCEIKCSGKGGPAPIKGSLDSAPRIPNINHLALCLNLLLPPSPILNPCRESISYTLLETYREKGNA